jgi:hypothetical protein
MAASRRWWGGKRAQTSPVALDLQTSAPAAACLRVNLVFWSFVIPLRRRLSRVDGAEAVNDASVMPQYTRRQRRLIEATFAYLHCGYVCLPLSACVLKHDTLGSILRIACEQYRQSPMEPDAAVLMACGLNSSRRIRRLGSDDQVWSG